MRRGEAVHCHGVVNKRNESKEWINSSDELTLSQRVETKNCTSSLSSPSALSCISDAEEDKPCRPKRERPICSGLNSALEADTFLANSPASSCTSGTLEVIPRGIEKEKRRDKKGGE